MSHEDGNSLNPGLKREAQNDFNKDTTRFLFFDDRNTVLCSSFKVSVGLSLTLCQRSNQTSPHPTLQVADPRLELAPLKSIFNGDRETAIRAGVRFNGQRYEVCLVAAKGNAGPCQLLVGQSPLRKCKLCRCTPSIRR